MAPTSGKRDGLIYYFHLPHVADFFPSLLVLHSELLGQCTLVCGCGLLPGQNDPFGMTEDNEICLPCEAQARNEFQRSPPEAPSELKVFSRGG